MTCAFEEFVMPVGNNISTLLGKRRENITEFARGAGISYTTAFGLYHNQTKSISFELIAKLCDYFDVSIGELFPYDPKEEVQNK